jgi:glycosyltransferase involved in cell wall biosynthesis
MNLSVIVATFNRAHRLPHLFRALDTQVLPDGVTWEIIIVDNNSSDGTRSAVEAISETMRVPVTYLFEPRQGKSFALNTGIAHANGDLIAFTDDDTLPAPDWMAAIVRAMREWGADVVGGRILPKWGRPVPQWLKGNRDLYGCLALMDVETVGRLTTAGGRPGIWGCNMAVRRELFDRIGNFDTRRGPRGKKLYRTGEETDLIRRALAVEGVVVYDSRLIVWHEIGPERMRRSYFRRFYFQRSEGEALLRPLPKSRVLLGAPVYFYRHVLETLVSWIRPVICDGAKRFERELDFFEALGSLWGHWLAHFKHNTTGASAGDHKTRRDGSHNLATGVW